MTDDLITGLTIASLGATAGGMYSARQESKATKSAANTQAQAQKDIAQMELNSARNASANATQEAQSKLKLARAKRTDTILSRPEDSQATALKTTLGV